MKVSKLFSCQIWLYLYANLTRATIIKYPPSVIEDANLDVLGLLRKYGYPAEEHRIETQDGFRLIAHRIPKPGAQPVLLMHGLEVSSAIWITTGPCCGLGYLMSDRGYDVWMLNSRGNRYSRSHRKYSPIMRQFWDFSFHELGVYDLTAAIDYILERSVGHKQVHYVGHSQGTTAGFVLGAERPSYMKKIKLFQALAPVAYFENAHPIVYAVFVELFLKILAPALNALGIYELPPENDVWQGLLSVVSNICSFGFPNICTFLGMQFIGVDIEQFNSSQLPVLFGHYLAGTSVKSIEHYGQMIDRGGFHQYDYKIPGENQRHYGSRKPPAYNLTNVSCKVALYYGQNDNLNQVADVRLLRNRLTNVVHDELLAYKKFNHADFVIGSDVKSLLYDSMFRVMKMVDNG